LRKGYAVNTIRETLVLAVEHHRAGRLQNAGQLYLRILESDPNHADALHLLGVIDHQLGRHELAVRRISRAIELNPNAAAFHANLGAALAALGKPVEAEASYRRALQLKPDFAEAHNNLANALKDQGRLDEAVAGCTRALQLKPDYVDALNNLGAALVKLGRMDEALTSFRRALQINPNCAKAHSNLGAVLCQRGKTDDAVAAYRRALEIQPDCAEAHNNLAMMLRSQGRGDEAEAAWRRALEIRPDFDDAMGNLAILYEELNRLPEAESMAAEGLRSWPEHPLINLATAKCEQREGRYQEATHRLQKAEKTAVSTRAGEGVLRDIRFELGRLHERLGDSRQAFTCFSGANELAEQQARDCAILKQRYVQEIDTLAETFNQQWVNSWSNPAPPPADGTPVFLIGFPRSGTTLLDVILDSHPEIQTLAEEPAVSAMQAVLQEMVGGYPRAMANLTPSLIAELRDAYYLTVDRFIDRQPGRILVDKFPLNMVHTGLILRVFPSARFIVALRHPCDVCLSCFMQNFKHNEAMANFFTLEDTAGLYDKVFKLWQQYVRVLPHPYHLVRYEDLVDDFETQTRRLLGFIGVPWDDAVRGYHQHAVENRSINTPSYRQVSEPIYKRARFRWRRYAEQLEPIMSVLEPHIEYFGYGSPAVPRPHYTQGVVFSSMPLDSQASNS